MHIKVSEATNLQLGWLVAKCEGSAPPEYFNGCVWLTVGDFFSIQRISFAPSTNWSQGGPIIEREGIRTFEKDGVWNADTPRRSPFCWFTGPTPLIAAMRCYVASKLGGEVEIPEELK